MSYLHIDNLYKNQTILNFKECYAMEKIHGTSAHISFKSGELKFFAGGSSHEEFVKLFDQNKLIKSFAAMSLGDNMITVFGEAYGGKLMGMRATYGDKLRFIAFEVQIGESWLSVPQAEEIVKSLGLEFVAYNKITTTIEAIDAERDKPSVQAQRNGISEPKLREGIVLRPLIELKMNNGERIIAKYKRDEFKETSTPRTIDPDKINVLADATKIAQEWVTPMRLQHVLDNIGLSLQVENLGKIIPAMQEDIKRESLGETVISKEALQAIGKETALLVKRTLSTSMGVK